MSGSLAVYSKVLKLQLPCQCGLVNFSVFYVPKAKPKPDQFPPKDTSCIQYRPCSGCPYSPHVNSVKSQPCPDCSRQQLNHRAPISQVK